MEFSTSAPLQSPPTWKASCISTPRISGSVSPALPRCGKAESELTPGAPTALITISHRPSLFKYHQHLLRLTGSDGEWETSQIGTAAE